MGLMKVKGATERTKQLRRGSTQIVVGVGEPMWSVVDTISVHYGLDRRTLRIFCGDIFRKQQICDSAFWWRVIILRNNTVSVANTIRMWFKKLVESGSMLKTENMDIIIVNMVDMWSHMKMWSRWEQWLSVRQEVLLESMLLR